MEALLRKNRVQKRKAHALVVCQEIVKMLHRYGCGVFNELVHVSVNLVCPLNLGNRATILSSVHLSCRSPGMLRGSAISVVTFGRSAGSFSSFGHLWTFLTLFSVDVVSFDDPDIVPLSILIYLYLYASICIYLHLSLSISTSSTILSSWDCNIFTDLRFTSFVSGHTFVIRNRSRVATSLTGGLPITLTRLSRWGFETLLNGYRTQATSPPNHIIVKRCDSLWFMLLIALHLSLSKSLGTEAQMLSPKDTFCLPARLSLIQKEIVRIVRLGLCIFFEYLWHISFADQPLYSALSPSILSRKHEKTISHHFTICEILRVIASYCELLQYFLVAAERAKPSGLGGVSFTAGAFWEEGHSISSSETRWPSCRMHLMWGSWRMRHAKLCETHSARVDSLKRCAELLNMRNSSTVSLPFVGEQNHSSQDEPHKAFKRIQTSWRQVYLNPIERFCSPDSTIFHIISYYFTTFCNASQPLSQPSSLIRRMACMALRGSTVRNVSATVKHCW